MPRAPTFHFISPSHPLYCQELDLRYRVLRAPLGLPPGSERFPFEAESLHLVAELERRVVGCVLFHPEGSGGRMFQLAVEESHRKRGLGTRLVRALENELRSRGFTHVHLHARVEVAPFYRRLGYEERGAPFEEIGIAHVTMSRRLPPEGSVPS